MAAPLTLSLNLDEIVAGGSVRVTNDGLLYAVDLVMVISGKNNNDAGKDLRNIAEETFSSAKIAERNTGGRGNSKTKLISFTDAIELIMILPGRLAKESRLRFADLIRRYVAGDSALVNELAENAASAHPINEMARQSLAQDKGNSLELKRKRDNLAIQELEVNLLEKRAKIEALTIANSAAVIANQAAVIANQTAVIANQAAVIANEAAVNVNLHVNIEAGLVAVQHFESTMLMLHSSSGLDERTRLTLQDMTKNQFMTKQNMKMITNSGDDTVAGNGGWGTISISEVAKEMGVKCVIPAGKLQAIGIAMARLYRAKYNKDPEKHSQFVGGAERQINSYTSKDRELMEEAIGMSYEIA
jgi:hypothetical protein